MFRIFKLPWKIYRAILIAIATAISFELGGNLITQNPKLGLIVFAIAIVFAFILYFERNAFLNVYLLYRHPCEPHQGLIMLVSTPTPQPKKINDKWEVENKNTKVELSGDLISDIKNLEDAKSRGLKWNWQQLLRALVPHKDKITHIYLLGSPDPNGSYKWLDSASEIIKCYVNVEVIKYDKPVDFEDFDSLLESINLCINKLKEKKIKDKDIIIDITGGMKTASVAGAIATLNTRVTFQYVATNPDPKTGEYMVWAYDVSIQSPVSI